ncbi:hypothetical protein PR001_g15263 [Phytophthora rubi]|uniref:Uncharacterized protein n=1 Tax=Phytophthora rubi TaxID=129364 RepID=A0A6A3L7R6_9STRA|nr:hypothetical protein PR001_g15263 [Phytophthora rubi]
MMPWRQMYDDRVKVLYFHRLEDLSDAEVKFLDEMVDFMNGNSRAFWNALHWIIFLPGDVDSLAYKIHTRRRKTHDSVSKRAATLVKRHKQIGYPSALQSHSLEEQLRRLDISEPARLQWAHCVSDDDRIAHVPVEVRDLLIPADQRDLISDAAP